jgi:sugar lactone lactonase YvrE
MNNERTNGETSNEKVQTVYKDQIPRGPEAGATDTDGYVYVSCRESNVICRLTPGGNFQSNVLTTTDKIKRPYGIQ